MRVQLCHLSTVCLILACAWAEERKRRQEIIQELLSRRFENNETYDNRVAPNFDDDYPTEITVQIYVFSFGTVTESAMEYSLTVILRQNWLDPRLNWTDDHFKFPLEVDPKIMEKFWLPDLYFINEKRGLHHRITKPNSRLHIYNNGIIHYSMRLNANPDTESFCRESRISMTLGCDMFLERYPLDEQLCNINLGSYSYSKGNIDFKWHERPVLLRKNVTLPRFLVNFHDIGECDNGSNLLKGNYSCIQASFYLRREFGYYIVQVYIPSILIVVISWVSFWIDIEAVPARVSLGLLTVLAMTTQSTSEQVGVPKVSYVKALDVWLSTCLTFVFCALLEFSCVNVKSRIEKKESRNRRNSGQRSREEARSNGQISPNDDLDGSRCCPVLSDRKRQEEARFVDKCSRVAFPVVFFIFNIVYWLYYQSQ